MMQYRITWQNKNNAGRRVSGALCLLAIVAALCTGACSELKKPTVEPFYAVTEPPPKQELRWSNGGAPKTLDPARALAAPEADIVRAVYDGLTDLDSRSLRETPGVAERWESSEDRRVWTFHLRKDARWSNGDRVTASDFVRSWKRLAAIGSETGNSYLYQNIVGMTTQKADKQTKEPSDFIGLPELGPGALRMSPATGMKHVSDGPKVQGQPSGSPIPAEINSESKFGAEALDAFTLRVSLHLPDKDLPALVAHPIFRPVHIDNSAGEQPFPDAKAITNGPFRIVEISETGISLEKDETYWNALSIGLERVRFVVAASPEAALEAYRQGDVDVLTNAAFEPVGLKLLAPYEDFRQTTHSALNFYEVNTTKAPFSDRRVREALALAIDRERLTDGDLEGTTQPARSFFPTGSKVVEPLSLDTPKAENLLANAGFANGYGFPTIRLIINRNNTQQRIARSVARMWKQNLNLETEIIVKEASEIEDIRRSGDFDLVRRGVVLRTTDDLVNLESIFGTAKRSEEKTVESGLAPVISLAEQGQADDENNPAAEAPGDSDPIRIPVPRSVITETDALFQLRAIPLYFPISYSLVKPFVRGFQMNGLDAPSLKEVSVDSNWQPKSARGES